MHVSSKWQSMNPPKLPLRLDRYFLNGYLTWRSCPTLSQSESGRLIQPHPLTLPTFWKRDAELFWCGTHLHGPS